MFHHVFKFLQYIYLKAKKINIKYAEVKKLEKTLCEKFFINLKIKKPKKIIIKKRS